MKKFKSFWILQIISDIMVRTEIRKDGKKEVAYKDGIPVGEVRKDEFGNPSVYSFATLEKTMEIRRELGRDWVRDDSGNEIGELIKDRDIVGPKRVLNEYYNSERKINKKEKRAEEYNPPPIEESGEEGYVECPECFNTTFDTTYSECIECGYSEEEEEEEEEKLYEEKTSKPSQVDIISQQLSDKNQSDLRYIAKYDNNPDTRRAAIRNINNQSDLSYLAKYDSDPDIREAARRKLL